MLTQPIVATVLAWLGILTGALTVFSNLQAVGGLSEWARWLTSHWQAWLTSLWHILGLDIITTDRAIVLGDVPFLASLILVAVASRLSPVDGPKQASGLRRFYSLLCWVLVLLLMFAFFTFLLSKGYELRNGSVVLLVIYFAWIWLSMFVMISHWPYYSAIASASGAVILFALVLAAAIGGPATEITYASLIGEFILLVSAATLVVFVARPVSFTRHLWVLLLCLATLVALDEVSKLRFDMQPPRAETGMRASA